MEQKCVWLYNSGCGEGISGEERVHLARILVNMIDKGILCKIARDTLIRNLLNLNILEY